MQGGGDGGGSGGSTRTEAAISLAKRIVGSGMKCGISLNPETDVADIYSMLETGLFDVVDLLAVEPGKADDPFFSYYYYL